MKKIIKIFIIAVLSILLISIAGIFVFLKTFDIKKYKPNIIAAAQQAVGRPVNFDDIALKISLTDGIRFHLTNLEVPEDPAFGKGFFLTVREINLGVSIKDFILKRQISVLNVEAQSPQITVIRLKDGRINAQSFSAPATKAEPPKNPGQDIPAAAAKLPAIFINRIDLDNAGIRYLDYSGEPGMDLEVRNIKFSVKDFSLTRPFRISLNAAFLGSTPNVIFEGNGELDLKDLKIILKGSRLNLDLSSMSMEELRRGVPQLQKMPLPLELKGLLSIDVEQLSAGSQGISSLKAKGSLKDGFVRMKELLVPLEAIQSQFSLTESVITLDSTSASLGKGRIELSGEITGYLKEQNFRFKTKAEAIDLAQSLDQSAYPVKVKGLVSEVFDFKGKGFTPDVLFVNLSGNGILEMKEGRLTDINVLKMVLDKIPLISNLTDILSAKLPAGLSGKLLQKDTVVNSLKLTAEINNGSVLMQPISVEADGFKFEGKGRAGFDQSYSGEGAFSMPMDLSSRIAESVPEMKYLQDAEQLIRFPLKFSGKGASVSFKPDVKSLGVTAVTTAVTQELGKALEKVFKKGNGPAPQ